MPLKALTSVHFPTNRIKNSLKELTRSSSSFHNTAKRRPEIELALKMAEQTESSGWPNNVEEYELGEIIGEKFFDFDLKLILNFRSRCNSSCTCGLL